jgi:hypothetical protein
MYRFQQKLKNLKECLKLWNKQAFGDIFEAQQQLNEKMRILHIQIIVQSITE